MHSTEFFVKMAEELGARFPGIPGRHFEQKDFFIIQRT
jgi:hypothetical protein